MKQIRKISNLVAEELINAGMNENDEMFEGKVSEIVNMIAESINESQDDEIDEADIEEVEVDDVFFVTDDVTLAGEELHEGQFVIVDEYTDETAEITILDEEGEAVKEGLSVGSEEFTDFIENFAEEVEFDESGDLVDEAKISFKGGKKHKVDKKMAKLRAKAKGKKFFFKKVDGKIQKIKKSAKAIKAWRKAAKKNFKGAARKKAQKRAAKTRKINSGFDIQSDGMKVVVEAGDIITFNENGTIDVSRNGSSIIEGLVVSESFFDRCVSEGVLNEAEEPAEEPTEEGKDCKECGDVKEEEEEKTDEAVVLTYEGGKGYVLVKEGVKISLGNRMRARAFLTNEGYAYDAEMLDSAADGNVVTL